MTDVEVVAFVRRVLEAFDGFDYLDPDDLGWRVDGEYAPVTFFVPCNDLFYWACADCESITPGNVGVIEESQAEVKRLETAGELTIEGACRLPALVACRLRKMRPQRAYFRHVEDPKMRELLLAAGPERDDQDGKLDPDGPPACRPPSA